MTRFNLDKANFNNALTYLSADSSKTPPVNIKRLGATLAHATETGEESWSLFNGGTDTPIISRFYRIAVLDNKMLSPDTSQKLSKIFFGASNDQPINSGTDRSLDVSLLKATTSTEFDEESGIYKTWVDLEIRNNGGNFFAEYKTEFTLPDGCFIKDYYLYVGQERKQGLLTDKRAALITYNNIIRTPRDPGLLCYKSDNTIELRVYPFDSHQIRKTGFLIWHSQSEVIIIDGQEISLTAVKSIAAPIDMPGISFVPAACKSSLPPLLRTPKYYFIIDASSNSPYEEHLKKVSAYISSCQLTKQKFTRPPTRYAT